MSPAMRLRSQPPLIPAITGRAVAFSGRCTLPSFTCSLRPRAEPPLLSSGRPDHLLRFSYSSAPPLPRDLCLRRSPELGLLSLLFALSMAVGSFFALAVISIPALDAFRRLKVSGDKLSKVVSEEVPGTLSSLKLSALEISDLTSQLSNLRKILSGSQYGKQGKTKNQRSPGKSNSIIN